MKEFNLSVSISWRNTPTIRLIYKVYIYIKSDELRYQFSSLVQKTQPCFTPTLIHPKHGL